MLGGQAQSRLLLTLRKRQERKIGQAWALVHSSATKRSCPSNRRTVKSRDMTGSRRQTRATTPHLDASDNTREE